MGTQYRRDEEKYVTPEEKANSTAKPRPQANDKEPAADDLGFPPDDESKFG